MIFNLFVSAPNGSNVASRVNGNSSRGFDVEFTPTEPGILIYFIASLIYVIRLLFM